MKGTPEGEIPANTSGMPGIYGTLGIADDANTPGSRREGSSWTDSEGYLWLFGGMGLDATGPYSRLLNDLWLGQIITQNGTGNGWVFYE